MEGQSMKKLFLLLVLLLTFTPCYAQQSSNPWSLQDGQKVKEYNKYGSYQGYYRQSGNTTKQYDKYGSYQGSYKQSGNSVKQYDKYGSYQGCYRK